MWTKKVLGVDLGASSAKVVQVAISPGGKPLVTRAALVKQREDLAALITDRRWRKPSDPVHVNFSSDKVIHRSISLPFKEPDKLRQALAFELEGEVPFAAEEMIAAYFPQGAFKPDSGLPVLAMAAPKQAVQARLEELGKLGIEPWVLEPDGAALARMVLHGGRKVQGSFAVMEVGASKTNLLLFQDGSLKALRSIPLGLCQEQGGLGQELTAELERTFLVFKSRGDGSNPQVLYLCGGVLEDQEALAQIKERWASPVTSMEDLGTWIPQAALPEGVHPGRFCTALGLAMYGQDKATLGSNMRFGEFRYSPGMAAMRGRILVAAVLLAAALGLGVADMETRVSVRQKQLQALQQESRSLFRQAFPEVTQIVDPVLQMQRLLEERKSRHLTLLSQDPRTTVLELLRELSIREQARTLRITELDISGENVNIRGEAAAYDVIEKAKDHWSASPLLEAVEVKNAKKNPKTQLWDFQCTAKRKVS